MATEYKNINLRERNSFGISVLADRLIEFSSAEELKSILSENPDIKPGRWAVLGEGNNILFTEDFHGVLLHPTCKEIEITYEDEHSVSVKAGAGVIWDDFVLWCIVRGLWGTENLSHIPSSVGAAPIQNIGAYRAEVKDVIVSVDMVDADTLKDITLAGEHCRFGYRDSIFKQELKNKVIITSVNFRMLREGQPNLDYGALREEVDSFGEASLENIRKAVINIRRSKLPEPADVGNAGSFFKNPVVYFDKAQELKSRYPEMPVYPYSDGESVKIPAGWLIEKAGFKGASKGNVGVYPKQALILVNNGNATGKEVIAFAREIENVIYEKFGIRIDPEVNIW